MLSASFVHLSVSRLFELMKTRFEGVECNFCTFEHNEVI